MTILIALSWIIGGVAFLAVLIGIGAIVWSIIDEFKDKK